MSGRAETAAERCRALRERHAKAKTARASWESRWQDCCAYTLPGIAPSGARRADALYDGTAADAVDQLSAALLAQLTPPWSRWFAFQPGSEIAPAQRGAAAALLDEASRRAQAQFDRSNFAVEPRAEANETAPFLDGFRRLVLPVIDERGRSRWPARYPLPRIAAIRKRRGPASFASQMLLQPTAAADGRLDPARLNGYAEEIAAAESQGHLMLTLGTRRLVSAACCWDPAFGSAAKTGDRSAIAAVFADADGRRYIHRVAYLAFDPAREKEEDAASQLCRQAADFVAALHLPAVQVETNGLGRFLPGLLRRALAAIGCGAAVTEQTARAPKAVRILQAFDAPLAAGLLHAHDSVLASPFRTELREWRPGASGRGADDGLDAVAACLLADPVRLGPVARPPRRDWRGPAPVLRAGNDFEP